MRTAALPSTGGPARISTPPVSFSGEAESATPTAFRLANGGASGSGGWNVTVPSACLNLPLSKPNETATPGSL